MNTFIEETATAFGWPTNDLLYDLVNYHKAYETSNVAFMTNNNLSIDLSHKDLPTRILQNFTRLFTDAKAYPYKCATVIIIDPKGNGHKSYTSFKTLASALNDDYKNYENDDAFIEELDELAARLQVAPLAKAL